MRLIVDQTGSIRIENLDYAVLCEDFFSEGLGHSHRKNHVILDVKPLALRSPKYSKFNLLEDDVLFLASILEKDIKKIRREMHQTEVGQIKDDLKRQQYLTMSLLLRLKPYFYMAEAKSKRVKDDY